MQTFLPYASFESSARCLDNRRLGKQRLEAYQIYGINVRHYLRRAGHLEDGPSRWENHPAVRMWRGYEIALLEYGLAICAEWVRRGFQDNMTAYFEHHRSLSANSGHPIYPYWMVDGLMSYSHQSNLVRKNPEHYRPFFPNVPDDLPYHWPVTGYPFVPVWFGFDSGRTDIPSWQTIKELTRGD